MWSSLQNSFCTVDRQRPYLKVNKAHIVLSRWNLSSFRKTFLYLGNLLGCRELGNKWSQGGEKKKKKHGIVMAVRAFIHQLPLFAFAAVIELSFWHLNRLGAMLHQAVLWKQPFCLMQTRFGLTVHNAALHSSVSGWYLPRRGGHLRSVCKSLFSFCYTSAGEKKTKQNTSAQIHVKSGWFSSFSVAGNKFAVKQQETAIDGHCRAASMFYY